MDFYSCVAKRTRLQRSKRGFSGGVEEKGATGSGGSSQSRSRTRKKRRSDSWGNNPDKGFISEREIDENIDSDVVFLGESMDEVKDHSVSQSSQRYGSSIGPELDEIGKGKKVVDDGADSVDDEDVDVIDIDDEQTEEVGVEESDDFDDKVDDGDVSTSTNTPYEDEDYQVEHSKILSSHEGDVSTSISTSYEDEDEDYQVEQSKILSCDESISYDDDDKGEEEEEISEADDSWGKSAGVKRKKKTSSQFQSKKFDWFDDGNEVIFLGESMANMEELGRKVGTESSGICRNNGDANHNGTVQDIHDERVENECVERCYYSTSLEKNQEEIIDLTKNLEGMNSKKGRKASKETKKNEAKVNDGINVDLDKRKEQAEKVIGLKEEKFKGKRKRPSLSFNAERLGSEPVDTGHPSIARSKNQKEIGPSKELFKKVKDKNKVEEEQETEKDEYNINDGINSDDHKKKENADGKTSKKEGEFIVQGKPAFSKESHIIGLLADCIWGKSNAVRVNDAHQQNTEPTSPEETLPLKFTFGVKEPEPGKSEFEKNMEKLWVELDFAMSLDKAGSQVGNGGTVEAGGCRGTRPSLCSHDYAEDLEIGKYCKICLRVAVEQKYISPRVEENYPLKRSQKRLSYGAGDVPLFDRVQFNVSGDNSKTLYNHKKGTVWEMIPDDVKKNMYPHQQEGFEFIWTNVAGTIDLHKLKNADPNSVGGCIISHAPGTGKTCLTIVFLETYLELFPECRPVIIAPASVLLTWEDEFRKWGRGISFHNLSNPKSSGKELVGKNNKTERFRHKRQNKGFIRMLKLFSWCKDKSVLGVSYSLYEKLAGESSKVDINTGKKGRFVDKVSEVIRMVLRDIPGFLVLDEGHTPRNRRSQIWKVLSEIQTEKRIILSGTPFQNNFLELYNTLCLVKPSFPDRIPHELKMFCQKRPIQEEKRSKGVRWEQVGTAYSTRYYSAVKAIDELKLLMAPFVHVYKGSILQKSLPGLRECVVILNPGPGQKSVLESIESSQTAFDFEHKLTLASIHPSLLLRCTLSKKEESVVNRGDLEHLKLIPHAGVKTRFLVEFIRMCDAVNEKVLVFSQYIDPLILIVDQLRSIFNWSEGKEVLHMDGKLNQKQRYAVIHGFNDGNSKAKVLLASTKACSEGINLVGASRVVLLDVVWNPAVQRQAISRAYRLRQKRVVYAYHLITKETSEWKKYHTQAVKNRISELVFSTTNNENDKQKSSLGVSEDEILDGMVQHDKLKDMFDHIIYQPKEKLSLDNFGCDF